jgi:acetolactate synthase-1/2/3 large subunit
MKVSDFIIQFLEKKGIDTAFTISGGGCIHLVDSLRKSNMDVICPHHEQSALIASEGYFRMSNKMSLNVVTTGPGGTNSLTGLMGMWLDSIPSIIISGQVPINQLSEGSGCRQIGDQEFDIIRLVKSMTKYSTIIKDKKDVVRIINEAYHMALEGRPGPVWLDIPLDIQASEIDENELNIIRISDDIDYNIDNEIKVLSSHINSSKKPLVIVGNGIRLSNTYDALNEFLRNTKIPVVTGPHSGVDAVDNSLTNYCGRIGILGQITSNEIVQEADLLIVLGSRLPVKMTGYNISEFSPNSKKIFVDIDVNEVNKHPFEITQSIIVDLKLFFSKIKNVNFDLDISEWNEFVQKTRSSQIYYYPKHEKLVDYVSFYYLISKCPDIFKNTPIVTSNGTAHVVTLQTYQLKKDQRLFTNVGCASMGYGLPASIGACIANGKKDVICIEGDGSIMMNLQELQTIRSYNLPIKIMIVNNDGYLSIKMTQESFFNGVEFASGPSNGVTIPDFKKIANAFDIPYLSIKSNNEIENTLKKVMEMDGPCILDIFTHPKERHEPKVTHRGFDSNGRIIPGRLTDMTLVEGF